ncbi:MAG: response regulator transcription factor [Bradymonadaceae bacterium]
MSDTHDDHELESPEEVSPDELPYGDPLKRERPLILLADDDGELRTMLKLHFSRKECDVIESIDGADTLEQIITHRPNLVILDVMMPELTGWEICKYVKERDTYNTTGVIMLTGIGPMNNELTSPLFGADDYIDKPFEFPELEFKVRKVLASKKANTLPS